ncbi:RagB/SusD family nutrient uptake outer membrane protein [Sphingobacterium pedocola]|nr:RagB/SusD family nutrient uptake outer membrane protein [Sphingobacterium pedocola]
MQSLRKIRIRIAILLMLPLLLCCSKTDFLDVKPNESMAEPRTLDHYQALMDSDGAMNGAGTSLQLYPGMLELGTDNVWIPDTRYINNIDEQLRGIYTWQETPYAGLEIRDWNRPYLAVLNCNLVLEGLNGLPRDASNGDQWDGIKGAALFHRAHAFSMLSSLFVPAYDQATADLLKGIPLRMSADVNEKLTLSTVKQTYNRILEDLKEAANLLPMETQYKTRPSKRACWALLSRIYLWMSDYEQSNYYADLSLNVNDDLLDYNMYSTTTNYPFPRFNAEVIFNCNMIFLTSHYRMDTTFYRSYDNNDLRKALFYKSQNPTDGYRFYGNYDGTTYFFAGLANDELYLNRAESYARMGMIEQALADLNTLIGKRWRVISGVSTFVPYGEMDRDALIDVILEERRKQLVWRGLRWPDLKRINLESDRATTLRRMVNGELFEIQPNDLRYVYPIPDPVLNLNPNIYP